MRLLLSMVVSPRCIAGVCDVDAGCEPSFADRHNGGGPERHLDSSPGQPVPRRPPLQSLASRVTYGPMADERSEGLAVVGWCGQFLAEGARYPRTRTALVRSKHD